MLELIRGAAGIRQEGTGSERVMVAPCLGDLPDLRGTAATPRGDIRFDFKQTRFTVTLPEGMTGVFQHPDGRAVPLRSGTQTIG